MNVLVTRPDERGQALVNLLNEQQIFALHQPLFSIEAGRELPQLSAVLNQLNRGDYVFAVSKNAVDYACETMRQTGFKFRADLHYFAVGQKSASYFSAQAEQTVKYPIHFENSEGLLELPEMQALDGKTIVVLRADSGREHFSQMAIVRGAKVQTVECYRRKPIADNLSEKISLAKRAGVDTIVITSGEVLSTLLEQTAQEDKQWLFECQLVVVGQRIARLAKEFGWQSPQIRVSAKADNQSLMEVLLNKVG